MAWELERDHLSWTGKTLGAELEVHRQKRRGEGREHWS